MRRIALAIAISALATGPVYAQSCNAVSKDGKPLTGAAKASFMKKCCEDSAKSKDGKPLAGAAKNSYVEKCVKG